MEIGTCVQINRNCADRRDVGGQGVVISVTQLETRSKTLLAPPPSRSSALLLYTIRFDDGEEKSFEERMLDIMTSRVDDVGP